MTERIIVMELKVLPLLLLLLLSLLFLVDNSDASAVLISDVTMTVMVELSSRYPFCKMHTDRGDIQGMLLHADPRRIRQVPRESVMELEEVCMNSGSQGQEFRGGLGFIYPGTKWCGPGSTATHYDDLGVHTAEDRCCRDHDHCPNVLNVGECRRGLCNTGTFTRSHCDCDARFRRCLQSVNTETANTLGAIFYNVVQVTCFQERSPCSEHQRFDIVYNRPSVNENCNLDFRSADLYVPTTIGPILDKFLSFSRQKQQQQQQQQHQQPARSYDNPWSPFSIARNAIISPFKENLGNISRNIGIRVASIGLAASSLAREIIHRPEELLDRVDRVRAGRMNFMNTGNNINISSIIEPNQVYQYNLPKTVTDNDTGYFKK